jgi:hypothetical protein
VKLALKCTLHGDAGATNNVECSLCTAGTFLTGSGLHADAPRYVVSFCRAFRHGIVEAVRDADVHVSL